MSLAVQSTKQPSTLSIDGYIMNSSLPELLPNYKAGLWSNSSWDLQSERNTGCSQGPTRLPTLDRAEGFLVGCTYWTVSNITVGLCFYWR